jgi:xanthine dehydrogenase YagR molybdenum-binding subunit
MSLQEQKPKKTKKVKVTKVVNGVEMEVEEEVEVGDGPVWGPNNAHTLLNKRLTRIDGPEKVTGKAKYTYDVRPQGMLHGRMLGSPHACAQVTAIDLSPAQNMEGVKAVISLLKDNKMLKYEGDPVAAVAAITPEIAEDALRAIKVTYEKKPHAVTHTQAMRDDAPEVYVGGGKGNKRNTSTNGDKTAAEAALEQSDATVELEFLMTMQHHVCLETHGLTVDYTGGPNATVYASTQWTQGVPGEAAKTLGLKEGEVTSIVQHMGGGFGSKFGLDLPGSIACKLSKIAKAPVKVMLTRPQEFLAAGNRSGAWHKVKAGAAKDGTLKTVIAEQYKLAGVDQGPFIPYPYIYKAEKSFREVSALHTHQDGSVAMRAPGHPQASFSMEAIMDELAYAIGMDPVEFRKKNTTDPAYHRQLDAGAKAIGWEKRPQKPGGGPATGPYKSLKRGMGCGLATWGGGGGPSCKVEVFIKPDGTVAVESGTQDLGTGTRTYLAAIVAEELGLPITSVEARIGNSKYGPANPSGGSTTVASLAPAVKVAAYRARNELFSKVAPALGVKPEELEAKDGKILVTAKPDKALAWKQACGSLGAAGISVIGEWQADLAGNGVHGAQFAEVEVDVETGHVRVVKMVGVQDCGLCLNRLATESQLNGGMIQALGLAMTEKHVADPATGNMLNATLDDYKIPGCFEMPELVPIIDDGDTRQAVIGMAEPAVIPGASAIANAVYSACGVRVTTLPITPDKILDGLAKLRKEGKEA